MCLSSSNKRWQSPPPPAKSSGTRSELRKAGLKHMFQARMRRLFPPGSEFVQESDLLSCFQDLRHGGAPQGFELVSSTRGDWYGGRGRPDSGCMCVSNFHWKLSLRRPDLEDFVPCCFLILGLFPAVLWVWHEYPKYVSGNQSLMFSFGAFFPSLILWETTFFLWPKTDFKGWFLLQSL